MNTLANKALCFIFQIICFVIHIANLFMTDILMYEATTGLSFDSDLMLRNIWFWVILIMQMIDVCVCAALNHFSKSTDKVVEQAYAKGTKRLIDVTVNHVENGDYYSAEKSIEFLQRLEEQQRRR